MLWYSANIGITTRGPNEILNFKIANIQYNAKQYLTILDAIIGIEPGLALILEAVNHVK